MTKWIDAAAVEEADLRLAPAHAVAEAHLVDEAEDVAVAAEQVVVEDFQPVAAALEGAGLAAELGSRFEEGYFVALLRQAIAPPSVPRCRRRRCRTSRPSPSSPSDGCSAAPRSPASRRPRRTSPSDRLMDQRK